MTASAHLAAVREILRMVLAQVQHIAQSTPESADEIMIMLADHLRTWRPEVVSPLAEQIRDR